jgi:hypothetical protein
MSEATFSSALAAALDRLSVPPLPHGFTNRLVARIDAGDFPVETLPPLPSKPRRSSVNRVGWRKGGGIIASITALGLATATAAATGIFGEPVYVPVVSDALAKADLVALPTKSNPAPPTKTKAIAAAPTVKIPAEPLEGKAAARELIQLKWQDLNFWQLSKEQRQAAMKAEVRAAVEAGRFSREDFRAALIEAQVERRLQNKESTKPGIRPFEAIRRKQMERTAENISKYEKASPDIQAVMRDQFRRGAAMQKRLRALRLQLNEADPAQQRMIRKEIKEIRDALAKLRVENTALPSEGNADADR